MSWRSGDTPPRNARYGEQNQDFASVNENMCGSGGVCRAQIPNFDPELHWFAEVDPRLNNPENIRWPGRWPSPALGTTYYLRLIAHAGSDDSTPGPVLEHTLR